MFSRSTDVSNECKCLMSLFTFAGDRRFDVCMLISACFCVYVNACVMTQLGGCLSRRILRIWGDILGSIRSLVRGADRYSLPMRTY